MAGTRDRAGAPEEYEGREQAYIKHELLKSYLEKLFLIVGMSSARLGITELCYVDCFSGPWGSERESLSDTSIGISLRIFDKCRKELNIHGIQLRFRALYVEKNDTAYAQLEKFLAERVPAGIEATPLHGDFVEVQERILKWCGTGAFVFFFIDPTGWKEVAVTVLKPLLQRRQSEFLINFMYDFVNRTASMLDWKSEISTLIGEPVELGNLDAGQREKLLLNAYRSNLKSEMPLGGKLKPRSAYVRVLDRKKERPKYHLVYLTAHPRGTIEFMEISEQIDLIQKHVRASTKQADRAAKTGMKDMFGDDTFVSPDAGHANIVEVENFWLQYLSQGRKQVGEEEFSGLLEDTDWFPGDFQRALNRLIDAKKVRNLDAHRRRPKKPLHWEKDGEWLELTEKRQ